MTYETPFKPPTLLLLFLIAMPLAHLALPIAFIIPYPWNLSGSILVTAGIVLNITADQLFKRHGAPRANRGPDVLVTSGPYALSRHPMYLGFALILLGVAVLLGSPSPLLLAAAFIPLTDRLFIRGEEEALAKRDDNAWFAYTAKVRRWL
jgi:protein-S-isoprenylcysteine O-methyltransferase Ste14